MIVKNIIENDYSNYKTCSMFIGFPTCTFKCEKDCDCKGMCQNTALVNSPNIEIDETTIINRYIDNPLSRAIVCGGLEPFDSYEQLKSLLSQFRAKTQDDFVIYTGYTEEELKTQVRELSAFKNVVIKFGRFIPNQEKHYDEVLGVYLASNNQYGVRI